MSEQRRRRRLQVGGVVQGVGFRPFVYALARRLALSGTVANGSAGVTIEVEGGAQALAAFQERLSDEAPRLAQITSISTADIPLRGGTEFQIVASAAGVGRTLISPDIATCDDCLAELCDPGDRRYRHPFISCTNCGPRFTIITGLPYDRPSTTMAGFPLCPACATEYADPGDRRFHAQTVACPDCGPRLALYRAGVADLTGDAALRETRRLLSGGAIVAVKGLGGYHLACDAEDATAVSTLRKRKDRGDKPFAVMVGDPGVAEEFALVSVDEHRLLTDPRRPVVLLARRPRPALRLAPEVAPDSPDCGVLLPYTPVHRLLFGLPGDPAGPRVLVLTSGNLAGEPIVTDDQDALVRLEALADAWLQHDRPIQVPCDDSVLRVVDHDQLPVRRSRGYAPLPISLPVPVRPALATGGDLKNTFAVGAGRYAWLSGHIGDMDDLATLEAFAAATEQLSTVTDVTPELLVTDRHPGYRSGQWAVRERGDRELVRVQHHHAHLASAMAENDHPDGEPVIGFAFDGTGFGDDGAVWGGEVLIADYAGYRRVGHLGYVPLPGGDAGIRNPCRMALSYLAAAGREWDGRLPSVAACSAVERTVLSRQLQTGLNTVPTSSMGRLFDAVSSLAGVCHRVGYEAEAAMRFEGLARSAGPVGNPYLFGLDEVENAAIDGDEMIIADPAPVIRQAADDVLAGQPAMIIAARFHAAVADLVLAQAERLRVRTGIGVVALSGGVFLNVLLTRWCAERLRASGFRVLQHRRVPPSDAGIALGQLVVGARSTSVRTIGAHRRERSAPCA